MSAHLAPYASMLPTLALLIFVGVAGLVVWHLCTDRRAAHRKKMESLALDDQVDHV
jgi:hypothetical protein